MLFTIIIPVYNCRLYLKNCVNSVLSQNFTDYELILVDDGSVDGTDVLCDELAQNSHVITLHQDNGGASRARNTGIAHANGDYIVFLDADDEFSTGYLDSLACELGSKRYEMLLGSFRTDFGEHIDDRGVTLFDASYANEQDLGNLIKYFFTKADDAPFAAWHVVISRSFLENNNLFFDEDMILSEDRDFVLRVLEKCPSWRCVKVEGYRHRIAVANSVTANIDVRKILRAMAGDEKWSTISRQYSLFKPCSMFFASDYIGLVLMSLNLAEGDRLKVLERASENLTCFIPAIGGRFFHSLICLQALPLILLFVGKASMKLTLICRKFN